MSTYYKKEIWKDVIGYEGLYVVSNLGRVKSLVGWNGHKYIKREKILKKSIHNVENYKTYKVFLVKNKKRKEYRVHRLVSFSFIPNPNNKPQINHKDSNPMNNHVENLEWCTSQENIVHSYKYGYRKSFKISKEKLIELNFYKKLNCLEIAKKYKVGVHVIYNNFKKYNIKPIKILRNKYNFTLNFLYLFKKLNIESTYPIKFYLKIWY